MDARTFETARRLYDEIADLEKSVKDFEQNGSDTDHNRRIINYLNEYLDNKRKQFSDL